MKVLAKRGAKGEPLATCKKEKLFKFSFSDVQISVMIENEIYCYINGFLKWNTSKKTSHIVGNKKFFGKICILNLRDKIKSTFARVIIRN